MAILQVRDIDNELYSTLKTAARLENRSISQEVISILEQYLSSPPDNRNHSTDDFLSLAGSWDDPRSADAIIRNIKANRKNSMRFG